MLVDVLVLEDVAVREADFVLVPVLDVVLVAVEVRVEVEVLVDVGVGSTYTNADEKKDGFCSAALFSNANLDNCSGKFSSGKGRRPVVGLLGWLAWWLGHHPVHRVIIAMALPQPSHRM